jgi:excinuclease ABC subunit A
MLRALSRFTGVPVDVPYEQLTVSQRRVLFRGSGPSWIEVRQSDVDPSSKSHQAVFRFQFKGFYPALDEASRLTPGLRAKLDQFVAEIACSSCEGSRLRQDAAAVRFLQRTIGDLVQMPLDRLQAEVKTWKLDRRQQKIAGELIREVRSRVDFLIDVGLAYLTLHRGAATLSGGEAQRIRLAAQLGSGLCGVLYVLDEPTIGLHPRDNQRLIGALHRLRDLGNTLVVVEHDRDVIANCDFLCDFGPRAGRLGGRIVAQGPPHCIEPVDQSVTGGYINGTKSIPIPSSRRPVLGPSGKPMVEFLTVYGASENNLKSIDMALPLGVMTAITGPSGSGKSSLVEDILYPALARRLYRTRVKVGRHDRIEGLRHIDKVIQVDQSPLGNSPSSNPATYTGVFDLIRQAFAELPDAAERRLTSRHFSFNVPGGRCETCEGSGHLRIEMHFLPDVWVPCEECKSRRYREEVLEVKLHGRSIADVLELSCGEATELFASYPKIAHIVQTLCDVGLDYVTLGQSAPTLSGGEAQRVKLAAELSRPGTGSTLYLLDEPTTGLHFDDIAKLLAVLQRLVDLGNTVVVIEHNLDVIKCVDWIIDLGPDAGAAGGEIVFAGTPEGLAATAKVSTTSKPIPRSVTAPYLANMLNSALPARGNEGRNVSRGNSTKRLSSKGGSGSVEAGQRANADSSSKSRLRFDPDHVQPARPSASRNRSPATPSLASSTAGPWRALGRKWHSLAKGFPAGEKPDWPLEIADRMLELLEKLAGKDSLNFESPDCVSVQPVGSSRSWAEVHTKRAESLQISLFGPSVAVDLEALGELDLAEPVELPVELLDEQTGRITLRLNQLKHVRSRKLRSFLQQHIAKSIR